MAARDGEKSLDKVFRLLEAVGEAPEGLRGRDVAVRLGLSSPTAFRMLKFLHGRGYVAKDGARYRLGPAAIRLGRRAAEQNPLRRVARPFLLELADATRETVHLGELSGVEVVYIDKIEGQKPLRLRSIIGGRCPLHCTGIGKALWAFLPEPERERLLGEVAYVRHQPGRTIATPAAMRKELAAIRRRGYAVDEGEHEAGVYCLGAPVLGADGCAVAAVSVAGAESYVRAQAAGFAQHLRRAVDAMSRVLGVPGTDTAAGAGM